MADRPATTPANDRLPIQQWVEGLAAIPEPGFTIERVYAYFSQHAIQPATLAPYLFFSQGNYTRNLIYKNSLFECMAICWEIGQASRIHNHRDQHCWMAAPIGRLRVQNFRIEDRDPARGTCRILPTGVVEMTPDQSAYVNPAEPVHIVLNPPEYAERAVSIHVYSKPFDSCEVYLREKGTYADVPLHYTSEYGRLNPAEKLL
jgi:cysteine dioxygenase